MTLILCYCLLLPDTQTHSQAKLELRKTLARLSRKGEVKREFAPRFSSEQLIPSGLNPSGLTPKRVVLESGVRVTAGVTSSDLTRVTEEELGVTVCLLPDWNSQDDGYVEADVYASKSGSDDELVVVINNFDESAWADMPRYASEEDLDSTEGDDMNGSSSSDSVNGNNGSNSAIDEMSDDFDAADAVEVSEPEYELAAAD